MKLVTRDLVSGDGHYTNYNSLSSVALVCGSGKTASQSQYRKERKPTHAGTREIQLAKFLYLGFYK